MRKCTELWAKRPEEYAHTKTEFEQIEQEQRKKMDEALAHTPYYQEHPEKFLSYVLKHEVEVYFAGINRKVDAWVLDHYVTAIKKQLING